MRPFTMSFTWLLHQSESTQHESENAFFARTLECVCSAVCTRCLICFVSFFSSTLELNARCNCGRSGLHCEQLIPLVKKKKKVSVGLVLG